MTTRSITRRHLAGLAAGVATATLLSFSPASAEDDFTVFTWAGYEDPEFFSAYVEKYGEAPSFSFWTDTEEGFQKMMAGFAADVAHPCGQAIPKWRDAGLIEPWDVSRIPEYDNLVEGLKNIEGFVVDGEVYMIPFDWGNTFLVYNTELVEESAVQSLMAFANPEFAGKVSLPDNAMDAYALASLAIGVTDWTKMTEAQLDEASAYLREVHQNVRFYWADSGELSQAMANGEVTLAWAWNETPTTAKAEGLPVDFNRDTAEGLSTWTCGLVNLSAGQAGDDKLYDFVNAMLDPKSGEYLITAWGYGHSNTAALEGVGPETLAEYGYDNLDAFVSKTLFQGPTDPLVQEKMYQEFERIKAGF